MTFKIIKPISGLQPLLLSVPHCGTDFPDELKDQFVPELASKPDDTDWYLDRLYDFAPELGITMIVPQYSRWVIDLNRDPKGKLLYDDGRLATPLCPTTDFWERPIYVDRRTEVDQDEVSDRTARYHQPYHEEIDRILDEFESIHGFAVFWDGHSIRRNVPSIQKEDFPDFILGDNDGDSASPPITEVTLSALQNSEFSVSHNNPFKGGFLTRSKGNPRADIHALQLEMSKDLYMSDDETVYDVEKAAPVKARLKKVLSALITEFGGLNAKS